MTILEFVFSFNTRDLPENHFVELEPPQKILLIKSVNNHGNHGNHFSREYTSKNKRICYCSVDTAHYIGTIMISVSIDAISFKSAEVFHKDLW